MGPRKAKSSSSLTKLRYINDTCKKNSNRLINQATGLKKPLKSQCQVRIVQSWQDTCDRSHWPWINYWKVAILVSSAGADRSCVLTGIQAVIADITYSNKHYTIILMQFNRCFQYPFSNAYTSNIL